MPVIKSTGYPAYGKELRERKHIRQRTVPIKRGMQHPRPVGASAAVLITKQHAITFHD